MGKKISQITTEETSAFSDTDVFEGEETGGTSFKILGSVIKTTIATYLASLAQTLTNKTINLLSNTLTGTTAQFNTANSDGDFATLAGSETLTNKTLTTPVVNSPTGIGQQRFIIKTATETVNNSATVQNDDDFSFAIAANEKWLVDLYVVEQSVSVNSDFKFDFSGPVGCSAYYGYNSLASAVPGAWGAANAAATPGAIASALATELATGCGNSIQGIRITGIFINGANAGTIQFRWAQNTLTAEDTNILANSVMVYTRLA